MRSTSPSMLFSGPVNNGADYRRRQKLSKRKISLQWRNNERGVSNHQPRDYLLNRLFRRRSMKTSKLRVTGFCEGNSPATGEFRAHRASNAANVSIWWCPHVSKTCFSHFCCIISYSPCLLHIHVVQRVQLIISSKKLLICHRTHLKHMHEHIGICNLLMLMYICIL